MLLTLGVCAVVNPAFPMVTASYNQFFLWVKFKLPFGMAALKILISFAMLSLARQGSHYVLSNDRPWLNGPCPLKRAIGTGFADSAVHAPSAGG